ncbi:hypothetical protein NDU88_010447, partial [Pleurodeles waltl]
WGEVSRGMPLKCKVSCLPGSRLTKEGMQQFVWRQETAYSSVTEPGSDGPSSHTKAAH